MLIDMFKGYLSQVQFKSLITAFVCWLLIWWLLLKRKGRLHVPMLLFCAGYSTFILAATILGRSPGSAVSSVDTLFSTWLGTLKEQKISDLYEIVLNVLVFMPMGMICSSLGYSKKKVILITLLISLCIETTQFLTGRGIFEICDLVHNALGGFIGAVVYSFIIRMKGNINTKPV